MAAPISRLTSKFQATIPASVRTRLDLKAGDWILFESVDGDVRLRKASAIEFEFADALMPTLFEWASEEDEAAYRGL